MTVLLNRLRDFELKKMGILLGALVLVAVLVFVGINFFKGDTKQELIGVEEISGLGEVAVNMVGPTEPAQVADFFSISPTYNLDGVDYELEIDKLAVVEGETAPVAAQVDPEVPVEGSEGFVNYYGGDFNSTPAYNMYVDSGIITMESAPLSSMFVGNMLLKDFVAPERAILSEMKAATENPILSYGSITANDELNIDTGAFVITGTTLDNIGLIEAYLWNDTQVLRITGSITAPNGKFPSWLTEIDMVTSEDIVAK